MHQHNPQATVVELSREEAEKLAKVVADKLNKAKGFTSVVIPLKGFSSFDMEGGVFHNPERGAAFIRILKENLKEGIEVFEVDHHINDEAFAKVVVEKLSRTVSTNS